MVLDIIYSIIMLTLIFNASDETIILLDNEYFEEVAIPHAPNTDELLITAIEKLLRKHYKTYQDINQLLCINGPGGFTTLRIFVSACNALSYSLGVPQAAIGAYQWHLAHSKESEAFWLHSTKRDQLFIAADSNQEPQLINVQDLPSLIKGKSTVIGDLIKEHKTIIKDTGLQHITVKVDPNTIRAIVKQSTFKQGLIEPWYGREG
jgi:tRNA A37 threonylcarbamoyladenosine modification protein TsaB